MENNNNLPVENKKNNKKTWVLIGLAIFLILGGFFAYENYFSTEARSNRETQKNYQKYLDWEKSYNEAMKNDTYGGKTPQETLDMFVEALRAGDTELASKYFTLKDGKEDSRLEWKRVMDDKKNSGGLEEIINLLLEAKPAGSSVEGYFGFEIRGKMGDLVSDVNMVLNKESQVWKIESL